MPDSSSANAEIVGTVKTKAAKIEADLKRTDGNPTLIRLLTPSNFTARDYKLCLSRAFCGWYMPSADKQVTLEGEDGKGFLVNFYWRDSRIRGGWRAFASYHGLVVGDALVLHLVSPLMFKVYIVRENSSKEVGVNHGRLRSRTVNGEDGSLGVKLEENDDRNGLMDDDNDNVGSEPDKGFQRGSDSKNSKLPGSIADDDFDRVKRFEDFEIVANGSVIDDEDQLPELVKFKYYQLCRSQGSFLHQGLLEGLGAKIVAWMIDEVTSIAYAIRALSSSSQSKDLEVWEKKLKGFENLGMSVGFILVRLRKLACLADQATNRRARLVEEREAAEEELRVLEKQVGKAKERVEVLRGEIESLNGGSGSDSEFVALANAPW
ncbi:unnamed protein product [Linum trigynum]|uniref:TF-B3 domain-containing protein n=1 Tax=Linum trigynum TaxID=586398 RepID=A0AAV2GIX3_9ROSI